MQAFIVLALVAAASAYNTGRQGGFETVYDSQKDGLNHPFIQYDSVRDQGKQQPQFNEGTFQTVYDSKRDGVNHPFVVSDSRRDSRGMNSNNNYNNRQQVQHQQPMMYNNNNQRQQQRQVMPVQHQQQRQAMPVQHQQQRQVMPVQHQQQRQMMPVQHQQQQFDRMPVSTRGIQQQQPMGGDYSNFEVIFDTKEHGWDHPWVLYDSKNPAKQTRTNFDNDPSLETIFDTTQHGWNHPWVVFDSKRSG